jgi:hypothetical protein
VISKRTLQSGCDEDGEATDESGWGNVGEHTDFSVRLRFDDSKLSPGASWRGIPRRRRHRAESRSPVADADGPRASRSSPVRSQARRSTRRLALLRLLNLNLTATECNVCSSVASFRYGGDRWGSGASNTTEGKVGEAELGGGRFVQGPFGNQPAGFLRHGSSTPAMGMTNPPDREAARHGPFGTLSPRHLAEGLGAAGCPFCNALGVDSAAA